MASGTSHETTNHSLMRHLRTSIARYSRMYQYSVCESLRISTNPSRDYGSLTNEVSVQIETLTSFYHSGVLPQLLHESLRVLSSGTSHETTDQPLDDCQSR